MGDADYLRVDLLLPTTSKASAFKIRLMHIDHEHLDIPYKNDHDCTLNHK